MTLDALKDLLRKYQIDALKTALTTPDTGKDLMTRTNGLAGEWGEFLAEPEGMPLTVNGAVTSRGGELADVFWYAAAIAEVCGVQLADYALRTDYATAHSSLPMAERFCTIAIGGVCEYAKKVGGHGREKPVSDMTKHLRRVLQVIVDLAGADLPLLLAGNVAKLRARHANAGPGGFDPNYGKPLPRVGRSVFAHELIGEAGAQLRATPGCLGAPVEIPESVLAGYTPEREEIEGYVVGIATADSKPIPGTDLHLVEVRTVVPGDYSNPNAGKTIPVPITCGSPECIAKCRVPPEGSGCLCPTGCTFGQ